MSMKGKRVPKVTIDQIRNSVVTLFFQMLLEHLHNGRMNGVQFVRDAKYQGTLKAVQFIHTVK